MSNQPINYMERYQLTEETYKILTEEGDLLDILNHEIEYDDYQETGDFDYE